MKKILFVSAVTLLAVFLFLGCSSLPRTERIAAGSLVDLSGRWNVTDFRIISQSLISKCLESGSVSRFIERYEAEHSGERPACLIFKIDNETAEHISMEMLSEELKIAIINSGKMKFVAGGEVLDALRKEQQEQLSYASEETAAAIANETGAALMFSGKLMYMGDRAGNVSDVYYVASAELTDIEKREIIWADKSEEVRKIVKRSSFGP